MGLGAFRNPKKEIIIEKIFELFGENFIGNKILKIHDLSISCLKLLNNDNDNQLLFQKMKNSQENYFNKKMKEEKVSKFFENIKISKVLFEKSFLYDENLIFYLDFQQIDSFIKKFGFVIL